ATHTDRRTPSRATRRTGRTIRSAFSPISGVKRKVHPDSSLASRRLLLEQLLEAWCALESGEACRTLQPLLATPSHHPATASSRDRSRAADESAQQKIPRSRATPPRLHGTIVPCASQPSVTWCSTWSCCSKSRSRRAATCAPRTGLEPEARRPTSPRGRP